MFVCLAHPGIEFMMESIFFVFLSFSQSSQKCLLVVVW